MNGESSMEAYTLPYVKEIASGSLLCGWGNPDGLCNNLEGREKVRGGKEVQEAGYIWIPVANSYWCMAETNAYCKAIILQL